MSKGQHRVKNYLGFKESEVIDNICINKIKGLQ